MDYWVVSDNLVNKVNKFDKVNTNVYKANYITSNEKLAGYVKCENGKYYITSGNYSSNYITSDENGKYRWELINNVYSFRDMELSIQLIYAILFVLYLRLINYKLLIVKI